jgi:hypothetical protein
MNQGPRWVLLMKRNGGGKSCATVPLKTCINGWNLFEAPCWYREPVETSIGLWEPVVCNETARRVPKPWVLICLKQNSCGFSISSGKTTIVQNSNISLNLGTRFYLHSPMLVIQSDVHCIVLFKTLTFTLALTDRALKVALIEMNISV